MGLNCSLYRATNEDIDRVIADPDTIADFIESIEGPALPVREVRPKGILGFLLKLTPIRISEVVPEAERGGTRAPAPPDPDRTIEIAKAWHGLHFLFTGTSDGGEEPACFLTQGGETMDDEGYSHALRPEQVRRFAAFLTALTPDELRRRYDAARMTKLEIYPYDDWTRESGDGDSPVEWLLDCFAEVRTFVSKAAVAGDGMIIDIS
jgi:hypothetical protein